jgi:hypothetical protein
LLRRLNPAAPEQAVMLMAAAGSFAAISTVFGSPLIGAVLVIEAAAIGGAMLPVVLLPGLLAGGIGSLVFIGLGSWTGLSTDAWRLEPITLEPYPTPTWEAFLWTVGLAAATAIAVFVVLELGRWTLRAAERRPFPATIAAAVVVGLLAIMFELITDEPAGAVLFSGEVALAPLVNPAAPIAESAVVWLLLFKGAAWGLSLGAFRGGPTFPAIFLGAAAGLLAADLPGYAEAPAVAALIGAACVAVLRLPLASVMIALLLTSSAGLGVGPLVIVAVVVSYLVSLTLTAYVDERVGAGRSPTVDGS